MLERFQSYYRQPDRLYTTAFVPFKGQIPHLFFDDDSYMHLLFLREMHETRALRQSHWTHVDNAPDGRVVYSSSLYLSWVRILTEFRAWLTGTDFRSSLEPAASWANPLLHGLLLLFIAVWLPPQLGSRGYGMTALFLLVAATTPRLLLGDFRPYNVDHQSLHYLTFLGALVMLVLGAGGWVAKEPNESARVKRYFMLSGALVGLGIWVGAVRQDAAWAVAGVGIVSAILIPPNECVTGSAKSKVTWRYDPDLWRLWGTTAAIVSLFGFLIEYFPNHLNRARLEANSPVQALGLYCAGWLLAWVAEFRHGLAKPMTWQQTGRLLAAALGFALVPAGVFLAPSGWGMMLDPDVVQMVSRTREISSSLDSFGIRALLLLSNEQGLLLLCLPLLSIPLAFSQRIPSNIKSGIFLTAPLVLLLELLWLFHQLSWGYFLGAALLAHFLATLIAIHHLVRNSPARAVLYSLGIVLVSFQLGYNSYIAALERDNILNDKRNPAELLEAAVAREVAVNLAREVTGSRPVFMSAPMLGVRLAHFGNGYAIGTQSENIAGVKASLDFFSDTGDLAASHEIAHRHKVTYVVVNPGKTFLDTSVRIPKHRNPGPSGLTLGERLSLETPLTPDWLEEIPWPVMFSQHPMRVRVFRVRR